MNRAITERIASLPTMSKEELLGLWTENFHQPPPPLLRKKLMISILAYRIQEKEHGGLSHAARSKLRNLAKGLRADKQPRPIGSSSLKSGTRLIRSWRGEVHEVHLQGETYEYRGKQYRSLSEIAREITGTRWSGPLFFGTKKMAA